MISERLTRMAIGGSAIRAMFEEGKRLAALNGLEQERILRLGGELEVNGQRREEVGGQGFHHRNHVCRSGL